MPWHLSIVDRNSVLDAVAPKQAHSAAPQIAALDVMIDVTLDRMIVVRGVDPKRVVLDDQNTTPVRWRAATVVKVAPNSAHHAVAITIVLAWSHKDAAPAAKVQMLAHRAVQTEVAQGLALKIAAVVKVCLGHREVLAEVAKVIPLDIVVAPIAIDATLAPAPTPVRKAMNPATNGLCMDHWPATWI